MNYLLITTTTCPKCPEVKDYVAKNIKFKGEILDETNPNFANVLGEYGVTAAPTMIILDEDGEELFRGNETSEIEDFLKEV
jgi:thioredoxin-related protein